ncbi:MAG TPA: DUF2892 domain-containing protein [Anaeromyxobacteraceae bacterium]|nr:DUF2892 domain-containing protein [Anaeromyxobacteraceae bacterium]
MSIMSLYRRNMGGLDRGIRLVLGPTLVAAGLFFAGGMAGEPFGILVALVGLGSLLTGLTGRCPLYVPFGISTARRGTTTRRTSDCRDGKEPPLQRSEQPGARGRTAAGW